MFPHVDVIMAPPGGGDRDPLGTAVHHRSIGRQGDEFYSLREYVVGDDLRRVHWRSTARNDELMVRQDEMPWQDRTTVVLDVRRAAHSEESIERAVSAAASVVTAAFRFQHHLRLVSSDGVDAGLGNSLGHVEAIMEYLATVDASGHGSLRGLLDRLRRSPQAGSLVAVLGKATKNELEALASLRRSFGAVVVVVTDGAERPTTGNLPLAGGRCPARRDLRRRVGEHGGHASGGRERANEPVTAWPEGDGRTHRHEVGAGGAQRRRGARVRGHWPRSPPPRPSASAGCSSGGRSSRRSLLAAAGSHLLAAACRRRGWNVLFALVASAAGLALLVTLAFYRSTSFYGLPTMDTWNAMWADLELAWTQFATAKAPVPADTGYVVAAVIGVWVAAFLADSFAFRALASIEAILPSGILFVFAAALGADNYRWLSTALWLGAALLAFALHRTMAQDGGGWLAGIRRGTVGLGHAHRRHHRRRRRGAGAGGGARPAGRRREGDPRHHAGRLRHPPDGEPAGRHPGPHRRPQRPRGVHGAGRRQELLAAHGARRVRRPPVDLRAGLRRRRRRARRRPAPAAAPCPSTRSSRSRPSTPSGCRPPTPRSASTSPTASATTTRPPASSPAATRCSPARPTASSPGCRCSNRPSSSRPSSRPRPPSPRATSSCPDFPDTFRQLAADITASGSTPYEKSKLLQDWFQRNFTYDLAVPRGHSTNAIANFLEIRRGYCEQFAGTYAAFARSLGIPSRVAVGFTPGELRSDGRYHVLGKHAHAWPEVYFTGIGWVPFEPTPSRGLPGAEAYTGVPAAQEGEAPQAPATHGCAGNAPCPGSRHDVAFDDTGLLPPLDPGFSGLPGELRPAAARTGHCASSSSSSCSRLLGGLWLLIAPRITRARWDRRRRAAQTGSEQVLVSWREATDVLARGGTPAQASETPLEFADRLADARDADADLVHRMADNVTVAAYARDDVADDVVGATDDARRQLEHRRWARAGWRDKLRWLADPRPRAAPQAPG